MIAAIYARKSTEQNGVADDQKSVARQLEHARTYAARKGWTVADACIYVATGSQTRSSRTGRDFSADEQPEAAPGLSGARHVGGIAPRARGDRTAYALKQLVTAGVRLFFYLENRERTLDSPTDTIMLSLTAFADELERVKARQRTYDAMVRKAKAGHVTGGRVFGVPENGARRRRHHRGLVVLDGEFPHRIERVELHDRHEFDL